MAQQGRNERCRCGSGRKVKRVGSGFGNVTNDRLRLLLGTAAGGALTLANCRA